MKVLIVDDDKAILDMIEATIPWASLGVSDVLTALDGKSALELVKNSAPDIVITDIEMPVMDGIELAEKIVSEVNVQPDLIFLTAHAEFEYARKAIQFGAADYLLKPFFPEDLMALLSKIIARRGEKLKEKHLSEELDIFRQNRNFAFESFLRNVLDHSYGDSIDEIADAAKKSGIEFDTGASYRLLTIRSDLEESLKEYSKQELMFIFRNIGREIIFGSEQPESGRCVEAIRRSSYIAYVPVDSSIQTREELGEKCRKLTEVLKLYMDFDVLCVISEPVTADKLANEKERADEFLSYNLSCNQPVVFIDELDDGDALSEGKINQQEITRFLRERRKNELFLYMRSFLEQQGSSLTAADMKILHHDLMQVFYGYLYENNISIHDFMPDETSQKIQLSAEYSSMDMMKYVSYMYDCVVSFIDKAKKSDSVIERAKKYISEHFAENIGRTEIAQEVLLAPNYLSMIFHKETGQTIREYINLCRVEEAKRLFSATNYSVTDIALQIGFDNISYFSTIFKKYTGQSPLEYRNQLNGRQGAGK